MLINKKVILSGSRKCYFLFDLDVPIYTSTDLNSDIPTINEDKDNYNTSMYNGPIRIFESLLSLNDHLITFNIENVAENIENKLFKGHVFPGSNFPIELPRDDKEYHIFIIEKIDSNICFVEEATSLKDIVTQIEQEINSSYTAQDKTKVSTGSNITDFLVFIGNKHKINYNVTDSEC